MLIAQTHDVIGKTETRSAMSAPKLVKIKTKTYCIFDIVIARCVYSVYISDFNDAISYV